MKVWGPGGKTGGRVQEEEVVVKGARGRSEVMSVMEHQESRLPSV